MGSEKNNHRAQEAVETIKCSTCHRGSLTEKDFYVWPSTGRRYSTCKYCVIRRTRKSQENKENPTKEARTIKRDGIRRDTEQNFVTYMSANPHYFQDAFNCRATTENILEAALLYCREGG